MDEPAVSTIPDYERHGDGSARTVLVTFGSYVAIDNTKPTYGLMKTCLGVQRRAAVPIDIYYFVANRNDWYLGGIRGLADTLHESAEQLSALISRYDRRVFVGNSMGGYAALAFGILSGADGILAFSPQTRLDREFMKRIEETRWTEALSDTQSRHSVEAFSITNLYERAPRTSSRGQVYAGAACAQDIAYARELTGLPNLTLTEIPDVGHDLARTLRQSGALSNAIAALLV